MYSTKHAVTVVAILAGATAAAHAWSLAGGLFLDDHWHQVGLRSGDWSIPALLNETTIDPQRFITMWWQERPIRWEYTRPLAVLVSKVVWACSGGSVVAMHAVSIVLHLATALMVQHLCLRLTQRRFWSLVGGLLFVVYSHSVYAVGWLAAQNSVLQATLVMGALLCYLRASGLNLCPYPSRGGDQKAGAGSPRGGGQGKGELYERAQFRDTSQGERPRGLKPAAHRRCGIAHGHRAPFLGETGTVPALRARPGAAAVLLWVSAMLSRETAIVLPVILASFDAAFGGGRYLRRRWRWYAFLAVIAAGFAAWRLAGWYHPMPDFYVRRWDGPRYVLWWLVKLVHYLTTVVWLSPAMFGPTLRYDPVAEVPRDCLLMLVILGILGTGYYLACRRARGYWIWPLWMVLTVLPVVPVMAAPHSCYLPGVGFAVAMILGPGLRDRIVARSIGRWSRPVAIWFLIATTTYMPIYRAMWSSITAAERYTIERAALSPPPAEPTDVFFVNLPFVNIYAQLHLCKVWESRAHGSADPGPAGGPARRVPDFRCHVLTFANNVLAMDQRCTLEQRDAYSFSVSVDGRPYFSGALGRFLIESMRPSGVFRAGQVIRAEQFEVTIERADAEGVQEMVFRFPEPLASGRYRFYVSTKRQGAARVQFWGPEPPTVVTQVAPGTGDSSARSVDPRAVRAAAERLESGVTGAAETLLAAGLTSEDPDMRRLAQEAFRRVAQPVAEALAAPVQEVLGKAVLSREDWARVGHWWRRSVDDEVLSELWLGRDAFSSLREARHVLLAIREIAARIIQTDLYLTGPPFPGPR